MIIWCSVVSAPKGPVMQTAIPCHDITMDTKHLIIPRQLIWLNQLFTWYLNCKHYLWTVHIIIITFQRGKWNKSNFSIFFTFCFIVRKVYEMNCNNFINECLVLDTDGIKMSCFIVSSYDYSKILWSFNITLQYFMRCKLLIAYSHVYMWCLLLVIILPVHTIAILGHHQIQYWGPFY